MVAKKKKKVSHRKKPDLQKEIERLREEMEKRTSTEQYDLLSKNLEELNEQITKMVSININLQSKMTELLIKITDLIRENRELVGLLEEASEAEAELTREEAEASSMDLLDELKKITKGVSGLSESFSALEKYIKRAYTKELLTKAVGGKIEAPEEKKEEEPKNMPEEVGKGGTIGAL